MSAYIVKNIKERKHFFIEEMFYINFPIDSAPRTYPFSLRIRLLKILIKIFSWFLFLISTTLITFLLLPDYAFLLFEEVGFNKKRKQKHK